METSKAETRARPKNKQQRLSNAASVAAATVVVSFVVVAALLYCYRASFAIKNICRYRYI